MLVNNDEPGTLVCMGDSKEGEEEGATVEEKEEEKEVVEEEDEAKGGRERKKRWRQRKTNERRLAIVKGGETREEVCNCRDQVGRYSAGLMLTMWATRPMWHLSRWLYLGTHLYF